MNAHLPSVGQPRGVPFPGRGAARSTTLGSPRLPTANRFRKPVCLPPKICAPEVLARAKKPERFELLISEWDGHHSAPELPPGRETRARGQSRRHVRGAIIGRNARIVDSYVGPFTSIYHDCLVLNSEISSSIVLEHTTIESVGHRIEDSMIGRNVELLGGNTKPRGYRLTLGDHSRIHAP